MIGKIIGQLLKEKGVTKTKMVQHVGCGRRTLDDYINEVYPIPSDRIILIAEILEVSPATLFGEVATDDGDQMFRKLFVQQQKQLQELTKQMREQNKLIEKIINKLPDV
jgi:transcriptional regulator with XRE-family HTH domain